MKHSIKLTDVVKKYKDFTLGEINLEIPCGFSTAFKSIEVYVSLVVSWNSLNFPDGLE